MDTHIICFETIGILEGIEGIGIGKFKNITHN